MIGSGQDLKHLIGLAELTATKTEAFTGLGQWNWGRIFSIHKDLNFDLSNNRDYFVTYLKGLI
jgi:hypothetical protein